MMDTTTHRREVQSAYNTANNITPRTVKRAIQESLHVYDARKDESDGLMVAESGSEDEIKELISQLEADMFEAADQLEFERAAHIRDQISKLRQAIDPNAPAASADPKARKSGKRKVEY